MLSLAFPSLVIFWGEFRRSYSPYLFLGFGTMVFGGILTVISSLVLAVFPLSRRSAGTVSMWGLFYYLLGLVILLSRVGVFPGGLIGSAESQLFDFAALGIVFSLPALATRLIVFRAEPSGSRRKNESKSN